MVDKKTIEESIEKSVTINKISEIIRNNITIDNEPPMDLYEKCSKPHITSLPGDLRSTDANRLNERLDEIDSRKSEIDKKISDLQVELEEQNKMAEYWEKQADFQKGKLEENPLATDEFWDGIYGHLEEVFAKSQWKLTDEYLTGEYRELYPNILNSRVLSEKEAVENYIKEHNIDRQAVIDAWTRAGYGDFINTFYEQIDSIYNNTHNISNVVDKMLANKGYETQGSVTEAQNLVYGEGSKAMALSKLFNNTYYVNNPRGIIPGNSNFDRENEPIRFRGGNNIKTNEIFSGYTFTNASLKPLIDGMGRPFATVSDVTRETNEIGSRVMNYALYKGTGLSDRARADDIQNEINSLQRISNDYGAERSRTQDKIDRL